MNRSEITAGATAASLVNWWKTAGVDYFPDNSPHNWLLSNDNRRAVQAAAGPEPALAVIAATLPETRIIWPTKLPELISELSASSGLPGTGYGGNVAKPAGNNNAALMIISDLPDMQDLNNGDLASGAYGALLRSMIAAIGGSLSDCYFTALSFSRPAAGDIPLQDLPELARFVLHQMQLLKPQKVLILGSVACQALLSADLMVSRGNLHYFNHDGEKVASIVTFHPRTLIARPMLKAQAWKDLQMLNSKGAS